MNLQETLGVRNILALLEFCYRLCSSLAALQLTQAFKSTLMSEKSELDMEVIMSFLCSKLPIISNTYKILRDLLAAYIASISPRYFSGYTQWNHMEFCKDSILSYTLQLECLSYLSGSLFLKTDLKFPFTMCPQFFVESSIIIFILCY